VFIESEIYDPMSRDLVRLWRTLSYHETTGGVAYTGLTNEALAQLDLSRLLGLEQAVLFARLPGPATRYLINNEPAPPTEATTIIRAVLPVQPGNDRLTAPPKP
jgi:hypothetical protein